MVHHSPQTARSTSLDSSSGVRDNDVPERELLVRPTAGLGHGGIAALAVGGEGALLVEEGAGAEATCVRGATRARDDEGEGHRAVAVEVAAAALLGRLVDVARGCIRAFAAIARQRLEQQPILPPHGRNHHEASRPARDGRCPDYCCCVLVASVVIVTMPLPLLATMPLIFTRSPNGRVSIMNNTPSQAQL